MLRSNELAGLDLFGDVGDLQTGRNVFPLAVLAAVPVGTSPAHRTFPVRG
jgi:hypothetical protein